MHRRRHSTALTYAFLTVASMGAAAPIVGVLLIALDRPNSLVSGVSLHGLGFANIEQAWNTGDFAAGLMWSAITSGATVIIATALAIPAGYAFATIRFPGRSSLFYVFVFGLLLPYASVLIPAYYEMRTISLAGTPLAMILLSAALSVAFGVFWMRAVFLGLPKGLVEAARVDGATSFVVLRRIALPLTRSGILVLVLLTFMWTWNSFLVPLVMFAGSNIQTATMSLYAFQGEHTVDIPGMAAGALFVTVPVMVLYVLTQRHFVRGITEGGLKM